MKGRGHTRGAVRPQAPLLCAFIGLWVLLSACKGPAFRRGGGGATTGPGDEVVASDSGNASPVSNDPGDRPTAQLDPGPYAGDARYQALAHNLEPRLARATDRLELATGLTFHDRAPPRVVLTTLKDASVPWRLEPEIVEGRRRAVLRVNVEPLVVGQGDFDRVLLHGLAAAAVEGGPHEAHPPAWFILYVGCLAAGDLADRIDRAARRAAEGGAPLSIDPLDPAKAEATAFSAGLLLAERSTATDVRRFVALVADGEDPSRLLPKWVHDDSGSWTGGAREILEDAASRASLEGDQAVARARAALEALGPAGLEDSLATSAKEGTLTDEVRAEAEALRLAAALREGQEGAARKVLERSPPEAPLLGHLNDPGTYVLLAAQAELLPGGDPLRAFVLLTRFDRDFPTHPARAEAIEAMGRLLGRVSPENELILVVRVLAERGPEGIGTGAVERRVRALIADHRPGAAARFLAALGRRAEDDDLIVLLGEIDTEQSEPSPESLAANRIRVSRWLADPSPVAQADVVDGGGAGALALSERLGSMSVVRREAAVRLLVEAGGLGRAVGLLAVGWSHDPGRLGPDLAVLASVSGYADLRRTVEALVPEVKSEPNAAAHWQQACLGLDPALLAADDTLLSRLRSPEFSIRRQAFEQVTGPEGAGASPGFLEHFAADPAILLRRLAVRAAGRAGLGALARAGLNDPSAIVRQAACAAVGEAGAIEAAPDVARRLTEPDPDPAVREAAAIVLLRFAAKETRWVRPVVSILRVGEPALAEGVSAALADLPSAAVRRAVAAELALEALGPGARADPQVLFRLFVAYRRASGSDPGYDPGLPPAKVRAIVARIRDDEARSGGDARSR